MDAHAACVCGAWQGDSFNAGVCLWLQTSYISKSCYTSSVCQAQTDNHIGFSCANVPCMNQNWSSVPIKTKVAGSAPQFRERPGVSTN